MKYLYINLTHAAFVLFGICIGIQELEASKTDESSQKFMPTCKKGYNPNKDLVNPKLSKTKDDKSQSGVLKYDEKRDMYYYGTALPNAAPSKHKPAYQQNIKGK